MQKSLFFFFLIQVTFHSWAKMLGVQSREIRLPSTVIIVYLFEYAYFSFFRRKQAQVNMEGQFLVRQIYEDDITYNLIEAAVDILSKNDRINHHDWRL